MAGAWGNFVLDKGMDASAQILKFRAVKLTTTPETVAPVAASTDVVLGVEQFGVSTTELTKGKGASVRWIGVTEWEAAAAIAIGQEVMAATDGRATPATGTGNRAAGLCVGSPAGAAGDRCAVLLYQGGRVL